MLSRSKGVERYCDADGIAVSFQLPVAVKAEVDAAHHLQLAFAGARLRLLVFGLFGKFAHDQLRHRRLVFYDIRPCSFCRKGHFFSRSARLPLWFTPASAMMSTDI